jgi:hypothetical protein
MPTFILSTPKVSFLVACKILMLAFCRLSLDLGSDGFVVESTLVPPDMQTLDYVRLCDVPILFL